MVRVLSHFVLAERSDFDSPTSQRFTARNLAPISSSTNASGSTRPFQLSFLQSLLRLEYILRAESRPPLPFVPSRLAHPSRLICTHPCSRVIKHKRLWDPIAFLNFCHPRLNYTLLTDSRPPLASGRILARPLVKFLLRSSLLRNTKY